MKRTFTFMVAAALMGMFAFSGIGFAAKGGTQGPPDDSGEPPDLGDIIVLYRDAWGLPILTDDDCQQPLPSEGCATECQVTVAGDVPTQVVAVDPLTCAAVASVTVGDEVISCAGCTQEVDFGRTSVIRSPVSVIEQSLEEAVTKLATAQCTSLDPAGRLVNTTDVDPLVEGDHVSATIDSPLENLAIYWQLMRTGYLGAETMPIELPDANVLNTAARGLGAAADKTGKVTVDQVVYTNEILGLTGEAQTYLPKICMNVREEVQGAVQTVRKCFLNYGGEHPVYESIGGTIAEYQYQREVNFGALPAPPYIPADNPYTVEIEQPISGWFEYLGLWSEPIGTVPYLFYIVQGPIMDVVFGTDTGFLDGNLGGFAQAADDTREVIEFTHDRPLPLGYETPVPLCDVPDTNIVYDLSISGESGLQVPKQIVDGSEGREFTVTVANAGPDDASGYVIVTADAANGEPIVGSPWTFDFDGLAGGSSQSWVTFFSIDLGARTTIAWKATAVPDCADCDLNPGNNTVTATSNVRVTGGGGGGRP